MNSTRFIIKQQAVRFMLPILVGALYPLGFAPLGWWPLTFLSVGLAWVLFRSDTDNGFKFGWLYGIGIFAAGVSWISSSMSVANTPIAITIFLTSIFCIALGLLFAVQFYLLKRLNVQSVTRKSVVFIALWVLFEWLRSWLFTGFPWLYAGYALTDTWFSGFAPIIGVFGLTVLLVSVALFLAEYLIQKHYVRLFITTIIASSMALSGFLLKSVNWVTEAEQGIDIAVVQGNIDQKTKWDVQNILPTFDLYTQLSRPHLDADLIVWPEAAITAIRSNATDLTEQLEFTGTRTNTGFITGIISNIPTTQRTQYFNSAIGLGQASGEYHKKRMVPFGEYVPFGSFLRPMLGFFNLPMSILEPGGQVLNRLNINVTTIGTLICYEIAYPGMAIQEARENSLLLTLSNDAWFGQSFGPYQHLQIARMRAIETGRPIIRATQDGVSAMINHRGRIIEIAGKQQQMVIRSILKPTTGSTPYVQFGFYWIIVIALIIVFIPARNQFRARKSLI